MKLQIIIFPNEIIALESQSKIGDLAHKKIAEEVNKIYPNLRYIPLWHTYECIMNPYKGIYISLCIELPKQLEWRF